MSSCRSLVAAALFAAAGVIFVFNREPAFNNTGNIIGGNFQSTMAGEFAFSVSLSLSVFALGVVARGVRNGKGAVRAIVLLAAAMLCHPIPGLFFLGVAAVLVVAVEVFGRFITSLMATFRHQAAYWGSVLRPLAWAGIVAVPALDAAEYPAVLAATTR